MAIDTITVMLLKTVLDSSTARKLFTTIATSGIAAAASLEQAGPDVDRQLSALQGVDLIGADRSGERFYVTAKGLKVARDLEQLPIG
jgi:hypothetical protein